MAHMVKTSSVSSVEQTEVEASEGQDVTIRSEVNMKKKLLQDLAGVQLLLREFAQLTLELALKGSDPVEKERKKQVVESLKRLVNGFVRDVLQDSEKGNEESLLDKVKQLKRMTEQHLFGAKKDIEKAEKKQQKKDKAEKKHKSKKKGI